MLAKYGLDASVEVERLAPETDVVGQERTEPGLCRECAFYMERDGRGPTHRVSIVVERREDFMEVQTPDGHHVCARRVVDDVVLEAFEIECCTGLLGVGIER